MTQRDRRRLTVATVVTIVALPALWLFSRDGGSSGPNVAAVGVQVENGYVTNDAGADATTVDAGPSTANLPEAELSADVAPVFLDGPAANGGGMPAIAVPTAPPSEIVELPATYSSQIWNWTCVAPGIQTGVELTIVNVDNGRSTTCVATYGDPRSTGLVLHTNGFLELADLTDAPIPVEIHK